MKRNLLLFFAALWIGAFCVTISLADETNPLSQPQLTVVPMSLVDYQDRQRIDFKLDGLDKPVDGAVLEAWQNGRKVQSTPCETLTDGVWNFALLPESAASPANDAKSNNAKSNNAKSNDAKSGDAKSGGAPTLWKVVRSDGAVLAQTEVVWTPARHWTFYILRSSHVDIGLHDSQYKQRKMVVDNFDRAAENVEKFRDYPDASRFRWFQEGQWVWRNYEQDRSEERVKVFVDKYIRTGLLGIGASYAGNHTQVFSGEELCRSAYYKRDFLKRWGIDLDTMVMADNNGITWPLVNVYTDAGIENILFAPNQWNPLSPGPFKEGVWGKFWNPDVGGGASRIIVAWDSGIPMVFYWLGPNEKSKVLVWCAPQYAHAGRYFGVEPESVNKTGINVAQLRKFLPTLEKQYPYDVWLAPVYQDNEGPGPISEPFKKFNETWKYPIYRTVGNPSIPFQQLREKFGDQIPTLRGDIASGWSQHPISAPDLLAQKFAADRQLAAAETFATIAALVDPAYKYPSVEFGRAYEALICNDEHSYGTSDYKGRTVYETWEQHFDWIDKASRTGQTELKGALKAIADRVKTTEPGVLLFNPTLSERTARNPLYHEPVTVPSLGYAFVPASKLRIGYPVTSDKSTEPPTLENRFYRVKMAPDGTIASIFDKELNRELVDQSAPYRANQLLYSPDKYQTFRSPQKPRFLVGGDPGQQSCAVYFDDCQEILKARQITQTVSLPNDEKRIDVENEFVGLYGILNKDRYMHYAYAAFPFAVENANYFAQLNGCVVDPHADQAGLGVEAYCAARDWAAAESGTAQSGTAQSGSEKSGVDQSGTAKARFGVALIQSDSSLVEFGKIHADKRSYNDHPKNGHLYSFLFNTWLQKHNPGGDQANYQFRYSITSYPISAGSDSGWKSAGIESFARQTNSPLIEQTVGAAQPNGTLPDRFSFLSVDNPNVELLTLKAAQPDDQPGDDPALPRRGFIARFHETAGQTAAFQVQLNVGQTAGAQICSVLEQDRTAWNAADALSIDKYDYASVRFPNNPISCRAVPEIALENGVADIGSYHTGLIDQPRAWFADASDTLYLLWGNSQQPELDHYELYRFDPASDAWKKLADVAPGPYRVVPYEDKGLKSDTEYVYRVRAVNKDGSIGRFSVFSGITRSSR